MQTQIEIRTLGQLQIRQNGRVAGDFISTKALLLFIYLAMHPGEHPRRKLAMMLWSETPDQQALKNLRTVLASIRQQVPDALLILRDVLAINPDTTLMVDATLFENSASALLSEQNPADALQQMQRVAELYQGPFLWDVSFREAAGVEEWISSKQRQFQQLYVRLLHEIASLAEDTGDYETAMAYARRLLAIDPYWESVQRQLMRLLAWADRSNEALVQYESFSQLLSKELNAEPEEETRTLYEQIRARSLPSPQQKHHQHNIILPDMPFIESLDDITLIQRMLNTPQCRLLTVYGISGIGKTSLVTQVAFQRQTLHPDGAFMVGLKQAQTLRDLPRLIATTLRIDFSSHAEIETRVIDYLKPRRLLLVLDNYEHLLPETQFVQSILEEAPHVQIVVTSQVPLNLFREWLLPLQGLRVPDADDPHPENSEAVRLFELTAQRVNPRFRLRDHLADVVEICRLVDGLPLALIISAGWAQVIPVHKIREYIIEGQELNLPRHQDLPPHHQSLEMMLDYTWNTLDAQQQYALTSLSIFSVSFDLEEVEKICGIDLPLLTAMIQKLLIQHYGDKYRMHQLIWRYARRKLLHSDKKILLAQQYQEYIIHMLQVLQQRQEPLHDYLLSIETAYDRIWNFNWMPRAFQAEYVLTLVPYLIAYWEISRGDELPSIQKLLMGLPLSDLPAEGRMLLHLHLARLARELQTPEIAANHLQRMLEENAFQTHWIHWAGYFHLYNNVIVQIPASSSEQDPVYADEADILRNSYMGLLTLYLDMRDFEASEAFFPNLLINMPEAIAQALIRATQGSIAAEKTQYSRACDYFTEALTQLDENEDGRLCLVLHSLLMRAAHLAGRKVESCQHLYAALRLAALHQSPSAMLQLLHYSLSLPQMNAAYLVQAEGVIVKLQMPAQQLESLHLLEITQGLSTYADRC